MKNALLIPSEHLHRCRRMTMTGSQQSGAGGNPSFDTPNKSVGGASQSSGPANANPGKTDSGRNRGKSANDTQEAVEERGEASDVIERGNSSAP
jgi:hypothetical protein